MATSRDDRRATDHQAPDNPAAIPPPSSGAEPRLSRRTLLAGAAGALTATAAVQREPARSSRAAAWQGSPTPAAGPVASPTPPPFSDAEVEAVLDELAAAGVAVYESPDATDPVVSVPSPGPLALLRSQVRVMVLEAANRGGILGADLDALVLDVAPLSPLAMANSAAAPGSPEPVGTPADDAPRIPSSPFLAAYLAAGDSPGANLARRFMPVPEIARAADAVYPQLVLAVFAAEIARENAAAGVASVAKDRPPAGSRRVELAAPRLAVPGAGGIALGPMAAVPPAQAGLCSAAQGFFDRTLHALFDALHVDLGGSFLGRILGGAINFVLGAAETAVRTAIGVLAAPVLGAIKTVVGVVGMASVVVSAIRPWALGMTPDPAATRLAVGREPPLPGTVTCTVALDGPEEWPPLVADCAAALATPLPPLKPAGARCTWAIEQSPPLPLVVVTEQPPALDPNAGVTLRYQTGVEDAETAKGTPVDGRVRITWTVARPEMDDLRRTLTDQLFGQLPDLVARFVRPILGPTVEGLLAKLATLTDSRASTTIQVLYHERKPDDPTAEPQPTSLGGSSVDVSFEPVVAAPPTAFLIDLHVGTCDGTTWSGTMREVRYVPGGVWNLDLDQTLPVSWSFADGERTSAEVGPFETEVVSPIYEPEPYAVTYLMTVHRQRGAGSQPSTLAFTFDARVTWGDPPSVRYAVTDFTNLGVPIPVAPGNAAC